MKSIRSRLIAGLSLIILFFLLQAIFVLWNQETARHDVVDATRKNTIASSQLGELAILAQQIRRYEKEYFVYVGDEEKRNGYVKEWTQTSDKLKQLLQTIRSNKDGAFVSADLTEIEKWTAASDFYAGQMKIIFEAVEERKSKIASLASAAAAQAAASVTTKPPKATTGTQPAEPVLTMLSPIQANDMIQQGKTRFSDVLIKGVAEMTKSKTKATLALSELAGVGFDKLLYGVLATVVAGILIAIGLMFRLPKAVNLPLAKLTQSVDSISKGNLDDQVDAGGVAEFEGLAKALERLRLGQKTLVALMQR